MKKVHLVVRTVQLSTTYKESKSLFECPSGHVIVGRNHKGDENGNTTYKHGALEFENTEDSKKYELHFSAPVWSPWEKESKSSFKCPEGCVIVGREHSGDENGNTRYKTCTVSILLKAKAAFGELKEVKTKESGGEWVECVDKDKTFEIMVQRIHSGDENGQTSTFFTKLTVDID